MANAIVLSRSPAPADTLASVEVVHDLSGRQNEGSDEESAELGAIEHRR